MLIHLVRHGRSLANEAGLVTGTPDDTLSAAGVEQVEGFAEWFDSLGIRPDRYFTSQWKRAQQTAYALATESRWQVDPRLGETDAGEVASWPLPRFLASTPDFYTEPHHVYPSGESHLDLNRRVASWFDEQLATPCQAMLVVAHSGPIACILQRVLGIPMSRFPALLPANATLSTVRMNPSDGSGKMELIGFSCGPAEHLSVVLVGNTLNREQAGDPA